MAIKAACTKLGVWIIVYFVQSILSEENISLRKTARQSLNFFEHRWKAAAAVDNCTDQDMFNDCCSHTKSLGEKEAWWQVDLGHLSTTGYITIYYRGDSSYARQRFAGFMLYLSNTSDWTQGDLCHEDKSETEDDVSIHITIQCPSVAQYVTIYNYRGDPKRHDWYSEDAILELCEVQVFGCAVGQYGNQSCDQLCSDRCLGGNCDPSTGACFYCQPTKYGEICEFDCSSNCIDRLCEKTTGFCNDCLSEKYGEMCELDCSSNCKDRLCEKTTGNCKACVAGRYGDFCSDVCSTNCKDNICVKSDGICKECIAGRYGPTCELNCPSDCRNHVCSRNEGECLDCNAGSYGATCARTCPISCKDFICNKQTGQCLDCYPGKYGVVCGADCPDTCTDNACNKEDGHCVTNVETFESGTDYKLIAIAIVSTFFVLLLAAFIILLVFFLRHRKTRKDSPHKNVEFSEPAPFYTPLSGEQGITPNVYEMISPEG
ncbi:multiple epidermal growth factor-like domains protein 11 isoform X3 [Argopecten irradians]|uniref:multiple epidermal growth factor-like domains protein 11 isoform X3 n=1 Tax=Argopecten irradians TaxID=31199 RepID=UPI00371BD818